MGIDWSKIRLHEAYKRVRERMAYLGEKPTIVSRKGIMKKLIIQKGTGYVVGFIKGDEVIIDRNRFTDEILRAKLVPDNGLVDDVFRDKKKDGTNR